MAGEIGTTRRIVPKGGFRIEIDGCGDIRAKTSGAIEEELSLISIREGGRARVVQHEVNFLTVAPIECERPLDLEDRKVAEWWENTKKTHNDHRSGTFYFVVAGEDVAKKELRDIVLTKHSDAEGDADGDEDSQMEKFTIQILDVGKLEVIA
jgi:hypothetical protein